ncbi:hypothetical protein NM688_g4508 [Phlebia brevispora]|uniref:Uncharacterized protein n=1 Tax=Phlebia brevispora TaxID=194682 RepID=A0ACC1T3C0_9APHY|nr:hypothetical protein NM688_g4508 [Phlebia brevispora]
MDAQVEQALELLYADLRSIQSAQYSDLVAVVVLVYDVLLNMSDEVQYMWRAKWSFPKVLYLIARYYGPLHLTVAFVFDTRTGLSASLSWIFVVYIDVSMVAATFSGLTTHVFSSSGPGIFTTVVDIILILRMRALYDGSKKVLIFMSVMMACEICASFATEIYVSIKSVIVYPPAIPGVVWTGCLNYNSQMITLIAWIPVMIVGFVCVVMTLYKYFTVTRMQGFRSQRLSPLLHSFAWDGTLYFFLLFAAVMVASFMILEIHNELARVGLTWIMVMYSLAGSKMILNLRIEAKDDDPPSRATNLSLEFPTIRSEEA